MHDKVSQGTKWGKRDLNGVKENYRPRPTPLLERSRCESLGVFLQASKTIVIERVLWSNARRMRTFTARTKFPLVNSRSGLFRLMVDPLFHVIGNKKQSRRRLCFLFPVPSLVWSPSTHAYQRKLQLQAWANSKLAKNSVRQISKSFEAPLDTESVSAVDTHSIVISLHSNQNDCLLCIYIYIYIICMYTYTHMHPHIISCVHLLYVCFIYRCIMCRYVYVCKYIDTHTYANIHL